MAKPLQVYLDDQDFARLERWAKQRRWTLSQAVRTAVRALTRERAEDPLLAMSGMIDGLPVDGAAVANALFVDSSAWIALASTRDRRHGEADETMREALRAPTRLVTTNLVLAEVQRWLLFRAGPLPARAALTRVEESPAVEIAFGTRDHHAAALGWLVRLGDQRLSSTDAVSFAVIRAQRCDTALTFDRDCTVAGFRRLPT